MIDGVRSIMGSGLEMMCLLPPVTSGLEVLHRHIISRPDPITAPALKT